MHGYSVSYWVRQVTEETFDIQEGALYPALHRLEEKGWIDSEWGVSETKRKVKFYSLTPEGRKQLAIEIANWESTAALVSRFLEA